MKYNESNFTYLKLTNLSEYYSYLLRAEYACEDFPRMTKIIVRRVLESFLWKIAVSYGITYTISTGKMIKILRHNKKLALPEEIYGYIQIIRVNGIGITLYRSRDKKIDKHPIEILELIHKIFYWYLNDNEKEVISKFADLSFKAPNTIEFEKNKLKKVNRDISLKDNQINNLRKNIIEIASKSKSVGELNKIIIAIKEEKLEFEKYKLFLVERINLYKCEIEKIKNTYENEINEVEIVKEECIENHMLLSKKESLVVRAELDNQQVKSIIDGLEEHDNIIDERKAIIESKLEGIRYRYEKLLDLTNRYQDNSETIIFTSNEELRKILNIDKEEISVELNFLNNDFYNKITEYNKLVDETKKKIIIFKEILDDKIKKSIKYNDFYNAFLNLNGNKLRILYSMVSNWNKNNFTILSKPKEWILNSNNEESFIKMINKTMEEIIDVSDDQIKLLLYYKLIRIANINVKNICNRKDFIKAIDGMIESAYGLLVNTKDFNYYLSKTHSIKVYYLKNIIKKIKNRYKNAKIKDELIHKIYNEIVKLSLKNEVYFVESLKVDIMNENSLKNSIRKHPFEFLSIIIEIGELVNYRFVYRIIFEFIKDIKSNNNEFTTEQLSLEKFLLGSFRVMLFISKGEGVNNKSLDEVLPIFIGEVLISNSIINSNKVDFDSYNRMIDVWKSKRIFYKDRINEKNDIDIELENILNNKCKLELNLDKLTHELETLNQKYESYEEEFKQIIFSSEKSRLLESYDKYKECEIKKNELERNSEKESGNSIIERLVDQAAKQIKDLNLSDSQYQLIQEAKSSSIFNKESKVFDDIQNRIKEIENDIYNNNKMLKKNEELLELIQTKSNKLNEYIKTLKKTYPDMD